MSSVLEFLDSSLFLGMHDQDERSRIASKSFFVSRFKQPLAMSLEHVGKCDDVIWSYSRELQDVYYPFMDSLHTDMDIRRVPYEDEDLQRAVSDRSLQPLPVYERLLVAMVLNRGALLYSGNPLLWERKDLPIQRVDYTDEETAFPGYLEVLYQRSRQLEIVNNTHT